MNNEKFDNDAGKQGARMMAMANRKKDFGRMAISDDYTIFKMYCDDNVCERLERLKQKLLDKNLMFKFNGNKYAIFILGTEDKSPIQNNLTLEETEDFAEKV